MRHALFVVFHYPPEASSSGVLRTLKFSRYLADFGWRVTVLTLERKAYEITDERLEAQVPDSVRVVRTAYLNTKRHLAIRGVYPAALAVPDTWIGWFPWAVAAGRRILGEDPVDLVFSTSPHPTAHLIGRALARRARAPHVIDFRDPWHEEPPERGTPAVVAWAAPRLERRVVRSAAHVVTSTTELRDLLHARYADERAEKFTAILNGYDEADFAALPERAPARTDRLVAVHAGNINAEFRDPCPLLEAIARANAEGRLDASKILLRFIGGGPYADAERMRKCVADTGLTGAVEFVPRVPYAEALAALASADLLLLLQASEDTVSLVPAKLYEYLRSMRPVLALVLPGATSEVIARTGGGWLADPRDGAALQKTVVEIYALWQRGELAGRHASMEALRQFDRRRLTGELAAIFDATVDARARRNGIAAGNAGRL
ncbi:MAG: glycosyltransferase [Burkholderiales bacterium]|nr:glycosyltransferase [Burkholderiales bacterium]